MVIWFMTEHMSSRKSSRKISLVSLSVTAPVSNVYTRKSSQSNNIPSVKIRHIFFKNSIFLAVTTEWNNLEINLELNIRNSSSISVFEKELLKLIRNQTLLIKFMILELKLKLELKLFIRRDLKFPS